ncbi:MAG: gdhB 1, partial [Verrucomicrobiales bacterium]|nr:gdhB 1 [Verrucomicrobiales bacterium]
MFFTRIQKKANLIFGVLACPVLLNAADIAQGTGKGTSLLPADRSPIPQVAPASTEGELAMKGFTKPPGFKIELFAAEPMLANPVSFAIDEKGRFFVSETHRYRTSVLDIRHYMWMLEDDLACRTVEDRAAMIEKYFGSKEMSKETEIVRLVEDTKGSGKADFSSIYADGFNTSVDGIASGVMARKGKVWFTNIPELWQMEGIDKDGKAVKKTSLSHGYGVHFSLTGHDMHGLIMGPDGKIYFSFGDRGANVKTKEGKMLEFQDEGAVLRCNP